MIKEGHFVGREKEIYELGLSVLPEHRDIIFRQAVCALSQGDSIKGSGLIAKYKSISKTEGLNDYRINYMIGRVYREAKQYNKAMDIFRELIVRNPQNRSSKFQLGYILIDNEIDIEEGMRLVDKTFTTNPDNWNLLYLKGLGYFKQGNVKEAHDILKKAWDLRPLYYHDHYSLIQEVEKALARQSQ